MIGDVAREIQRVSVRHASGAFSRAGLVQARAARSVRCPSDASLTYEPTVGRSLRTVHIARRAIRMGSARALKRARHRPSCVACRRGRGMTGLQWSDRAVGDQRDQRQRAIRLLRAQWNAALAAHGWKMADTTIGSWAGPVRRRRTRDTTHAGCSLAYRARLDCTGRSLPVSQPGRAKLGVTALMDVGGMHIVNTRVRSRDAAAWVGVMGRERADRHSVSSRRRRRCLGEPGGGVRAHHVRWSRGRRAGPRTCETGSRSCLAG